MSYEQLCLGCMQENGGAEKCSHCGFLKGSGPKSLHHLPPGTILAEKYLIGTVLGQGGFGITYLAWDTNLNIKLAIKEYFPSGMLSRVPGQTNVEANSFEGKEQFIYGLDRFLSEAKTLAQFFEHPNIVTVRDFFRANDTAYMVMNYVNGITLGEYLRQSGGRLPYEKAAVIMMPLLDALKEVHRSGYLHRDISPDNIFIDTKGRVTLIDFGAARQEMQQKSRDLSVIMKVGYSPEEQYRSKGIQGPWTDIYAAAATFYRLLTGEVPPESIDRVAEDTLVLPSELGIEINPPMEMALQKALAVRSQDRYQSIDEFQSALLDGEKKTVIETEQQDDQQIDAPVAQSTIEGEEESLKLEPKSKDTITDPVSPRKQKNLKAISAAAAVIIAAIGLIAGGAGLFGGSEATEIATDENNPYENGEEQQDALFETGEISWDSGVYQGELLNNTPHGFGIWTTSSGDYYEGNWKEGLYNGQGIFIWGEMPSTPDLNMKVNGGMDLKMVTVSLL